jgi:hypothetical protein
MKPADRKLAYSGVIILAVLAAELAWFLFIGPADNGSDQGSKQQAEDLFLGFSPEAWTAIFTAVLTASTIGLWLQTKRLAAGAEEQSSDMKASIAAAQRSADAAWLSAQASIGAETARLIPVSAFLQDSPSMFAKPDPYGGTVEPTVDELLAKGIIVIEFKNLGRTAAEIIAFCGETSLSPDLPEIPVYAKIKRHSPCETAEAHGKTFREYVFDWERPKPDKANSLSSLFTVHKIWLFGYLEYLDFMGVRYRQRFCMYLAGGLISYGKNFWPGGPPQYSLLEKADAETKT